MPVCLRDVSCYWLRGVLVLDRQPGIMMSPWVSVVQGEHIAGCICRGH